MGYESKIYVVKKVILMARAKRSLRKKLQSSIYAKFTV